MIRKGLNLLFTTVLLSILSIEGVWSQSSTRNLGGTVVDENGEALIGVAVRVADTMQGTTTDVNGSFQLALPQGKTIIEISYLGYQTQRIDTRNKPDNLAVRMKPEDVSLNEVVVIGYGTVKKRDLTGAVTSVKNADITVAPTGNIMEALQGKIAGMDITKTSSQVGANPSILLRGSRSIYGDNSPLFVIDGIPGNYSDVNPQDVESVDVLKDASATAIYGSAGANGVVIITTKRGSTGKATVNFDAYYGFSGKPTYYNGMTGDEWTNYQREAYKYLNGQYPTDMSAIITDPVNLQHFNNNDWIDWEDQLLQGTATTQKYTLSVSGGSEKTKLFASLSFENNEGLLPGESLKNYGLRLNIDQQIFRWAKVGFTSNLSYSDKNTGTQKAFTTALSAFPLGAMRNDKGELNYEYATGEFTPLGDFLPYQFADNTKQTIVRPTGYLELTPLKGLTFKSTLGALLSHSKRGQYWGEQATSLRPTYAGSPYAEVNATDQWQYTWDNVLSYTHTFAGVHNVSGTLVSTYTHDVVETTTTGGSGQNIDSWFWHSLGSAAGQHIDSTYKQYQKMGYALRLNYSYAGRYLITFSNRWDGVSWLSPGHKWDSFPAGAIAWRISDEPFMASASHWIDNLKLRMGYGVTGNSGGVGPYGTGSKPIVYSGSGISVDGKIGSFAQYTETYGNPSLGWEKSDNLNVGLDFTLLKGRIDGSIDWFNTKTRGLLFKRTMPITGGVTGWGSPLASWENIAKTENKGLEITLNTRNIQTKTFTWSSNLTLTWGKEKITSLPSGDLINESLFIGQPIHAIYGYKYAGIWASDTPADVLAAYGVKPGWVKIETVEQADDGGVHKYSDKDRQVVGHNNPNLILGFNNTLSWKGIDLTLYLMARYGQTITSKLLGWYTAKTGNANNQIAGADYWTQDNQSAYYPVPGSGSEQNVMTALTYRDGSFIKVKNITLGYTLPASLSRHLYMNRLRLYATAYNPFIYVKDKQLKGTDPENNGADSFPLYKQFVFGINITF